MATSNSTPIYTGLTDVREIGFGPAACQPVWSAQLMYDDSRDHSRSDANPEITTARQAAEALFRAKTRQPRKEVLDASALAEQPLRKPRILPVINSAPGRAEEITNPVIPKKPRADSIPASDVARIRTWLKYGMTLQEVAQVYRVATSAIERLLQPKITG